MDWKTFYRRELEEPGARELLLSFLRDRGRSLEGVIARGGILSFPHTARDHAGPSISRTVMAILRTPGIERVIALGVLHLGSLPPPLRELWRLARDPGVPVGRRRRAWEEVSGAFVPEGDTVKTPFGRVPLWRPLRLAGPIRPGGRIVEAEFSLDSFFSLLALASGELGRSPPPVLPLYVGPILDPVEGDARLATELAVTLKRLIGPHTAVVTTGDPVHYGRPYGDEPLKDGLPPDPGELARRFRRELEELLRIALFERDYPEAWRRATLLKDDQREILPVIAELLGPGAGYKILSFELSDYSGILGAEPPCYVASCLIAYYRAGPDFDFPSIFPQDGEQTEMR